MESNVLDQSVSSTQLTRNITLSSYFPQGTQFFYGYPAGEDSGFLNRVPPSVEELVAARPLCCAGENVQVIHFSATAAPAIDPSLLERLHLPCLPASQDIILPNNIDTSLKGDDRNKAVKIALQGLSAPHKLVMAQPYTDQTLADLFQIDPLITSWLNNKTQMTDYLDQDAMPHRYASYHSGTDFAADTLDVVLPVVIKAASSSSGDGVYICQTEDDIANAQASLGKLKASIFVEQYIETIHNYGLHFGIPHDTSEPIQIIGINEQLTSPTGEFLGGIINDQQRSAKLDQTIAYLRDTVLPKVRAKGWYGIGCFDVLEDRNGNHYFIDCNFRMTGMSAYHFLRSNDIIKGAMISFGASFNGTQQQLENLLSPLLSQQASSGLQLIALSHHDDIWSFNTALSYDTHEDVFRIANALLDSGVESQALSQIVAGQTIA